MKMREFLKVNSLKQVDIARYLGVSEAAISNVVKGKSEFSTENLIKIMTNPHGWDVSMLTEEKPENPAVENPQERVTIERLFAIIDSQRADINTLLAMIKEKDEQINQLREQLDARKRGTAPDAGNSSSADAV